MVVELPDGTLFLAGYAGGIYTKNTGIGQTVPELGKSSDRGATWTAINVGTEADGARGNSDVDLAAGPHGTLYFVASTYDPKLAEGTRVSVGASENEGGTWHWTTLSRERFDDRPWVGGNARWSGTRSLERRSRRVLLREPRPRRYVEHTRPNQFQRRIKRSRPRSAVGGLGLA